MIVITQNWSKFVQEQQKTNQRKTCIKRSSELVIWHAPFELVTAE